MTTSTHAVSKAAHFASMLGMSAAGFAVVGVGGASLGVLPAFGGFLLMVLGLGFALVGVVTSVVGLVQTSPSKGLEGRGLALRGLLLCGVVVFAIGSGAARGRGLPRINDITTNVDDPPVFVAALEIDANKGRDMAYPGVSFATQQQEAYPDLASMVLDDAPAVVYDRVHTVLASMPRMRIVGESLADGRIEATETSALFHFADDVVVRIRPYQDGGSIVDIRSKSRDGKGDLGVNAARIRRIIERVHRGAPESGD